MSFQELQAKREEMEKTLPSLADLDDWIPCAIQRKPAVVLASKTDIADRILYQVFPAEGAWAKVYDYLALMEKIRDTFISEPLEEALLADTEEEISAENLKEMRFFRDKGGRIHVVPETDLDREQYAAKLAEGWDESHNFIHRRVREPDTFQPYSFRTIWLSQDEGIRAVVGRLRGEDKLTIQSIIFSKKKGWTLEKAQGWIKDHPDLQVNESEPVQ